MPSGCCVVNCTNTRAKAEEHGVKLYSFPKDKLISKRWKEACGPKANLIAKRLKICGDHFTEQDWNMQDVYLNVPRNKRRLRTSAVPSVNMGASPTTRNLKQAAVMEQNIIQTHDCLNTPPVDMKVFEQQDTIVDNPNTKLRTDSLDQIDVIQELQQQSSLKEVQVTDIEDYDQLDRRQLLITMSIKEKANLFDNLVDNFSDKILTLGIWGSKKKKRSFSYEQLRLAFLPVLDRLWKEDSLSMAFRQPVDLTAFPNYIDIVKKPMDLSTIRMNLNSDKYSNPWEFVDDVWLMFDNAWLYNNKKSKIYRCCTELSLIFRREIDPVMKDFGYCCGQKYTFKPQVLRCYGKPTCSIAVNAKYYSYENKYAVCQKCFCKIPGDTVPLGDDPQQIQIDVQKDRFKVMNNNQLEPETFVDCLECGRKQHHICVLYLDDIWPNGFTCDTCLKERSLKRKENKFNAKNLPTTRLGNHIEIRVNTFLEREKADAGQIHIRVVSYSNKAVEVKPGMNGKMIFEFPYQAKALFAFQEIDGVDVCFFGMQVQEYGSECAFPNTRRIYLAYLYSVQFLVPREYRTAVYQEILLGYMDYVKQLGYVTTHIWACPPRKGIDYIFYSHPPDQKIPTPAILQQWYKTLLDKGKKEGIIHDYKDILQQSKEDNLTSVTELPQFEGDLWPDIFEKTIKEIDQKEEKKRKRTTSVNARNPKKFKGSDSARGKDSKKTDQQNSGSDLMAKIFATMEENKESFFVVHLRSEPSTSSLKAPPIQDPDALMDCDLMDGRHKFLELARDKRYEFSSSRRAKFSTLNLLYELHQQLYSHLFKLIINRYRF